MKASLRGIALLWLLTGSVASAQQVHDRAGYGPASICVAGCAVAVHDGEAANISGTHGGIMLRGEDFDLEARAETGFSEGGREFQASTVTLPGIGAITRHYYPRQWTATAGIPGEAAMAEEKDHNEYVPPAIGTEPAVRLESSAFDGDNDATALARLSRMSGHCDPLSEDANGRLSIEVMRWSQMRVKGPTRVCEGALAIHVAAGEEAQRSWKGRSGNFISYDWRVSGRDWQVDAGGAKRFNKNLPLGPFDEIGYSVSPNEGGATLLPPASYPKDIIDSGLVFLSTRGLSEKDIQTFLHRMEYLSSRKSCWQ